MKLESREWEGFYFKDLFVTEKKKKLQVPTGAYIHKNDIYIASTPRITVTSENNGIDSYCKSMHKNYRKFKNFISTSFLGTVFYHRYEASIDMKVHALHLKQKKLDVFSGTFLTTEIKKSIASASYGNQISSTDLPNKKLLLPISTNNKPDYKFIQDYSKSIFEKKEQKYKDYITKVLAKLEYKEIISLQDKEWKEFFIVDIFNTMQRGKRLTKANQTEGNIPYVSSTASNNGIDNFIGNTQGVRMFENCLTIANSGSVGASFYHPYKFVASDHITHLQKEEMNEYVYLFISTLTNRFSKKYNFNREINDARISREKILLPINNKNEPDYEYMEQYIKNLKYRKIKQYLDFKKSNQGS